jgi:HTH-type transcriptional regulator/antitoxin HigA
MEFKPIRTEAEYQAALKAIEPYFDNEPALGSEESDRFEILGLIIEAYEAKHFPIDLPDPIEAIKFRMDQAGLTAKDLVPAIGQLNRVYEILNRKRSLTLKMIQNLHEQFGIPAESLIQPMKKAA